MRRTRFLLACALVATILAPTEVGAAKKPLPIQAHGCGDVVTTSFRLANDLRGCTDDALIVNRDNLTIDLNGKTLSGDGTGLGINNFFNDDDGLVVKNGSIKGFAQGIFTQGSEGRFQNLTLSANVSHGLQFDADNNTASGIVATNNGGAGVMVQSGTGNTVTASTLVRNVGNGVHVASGASETTIKGNRSSGNAGNGIRVDGDLNTIAKNIVEGNGSLSTIQGMLLATGAQDNNTTLSTFNGNGSDGYADQGTSNRVTDSIARGNGFMGGANGGGRGFNAQIATEPEGSGNRASGNDDTAAPCSPASLC